MWISYTTVAIDTQTNQSEKERSTPKRTCQYTNVWMKAALCYTGTRNREALIHSKSFYKDIEKNFGCSYRNRERKGERERKRAIGATTFSLATSISQLFIEYIQIESLFVTFPCTCFPPDFLDFPFLTFTFLCSMLAICL